MKILDGTKALRFYEKINVFFQLLFLVYVSLKVNMTRIFVTGQGNFYSLQPNGTPNKLHENYAWKPAPERWLIDMKI